MVHDAFICHASEDKDEIARPLAERLIAAGLSVWYDEFSLVLGDSLRESIDRGLAASRFGIVILSPAFFAKKWAQAELNGLFAKEIAGEKTIIPLWHKITQAEVAQHSPILADRVAASTSHGLDSILERLLDVTRPGWRHRAARGRAVALSPTSARLHSGGWAIQTPISIVNRSDMPLYAVTLKVLITGASVTADSIEIEADAQVPPLETTMGNIVVSADQVRLDCSNAQEQQLIFFTVHTVPARGQRTISLKGTTPVDSTAEISIANFEDVPRELYTKGANQLVVAIRPPEPVKLHGVRVRMRKV